MTRLFYALWRAAAPQRQCVKYIYLSINQGTLPKSTDKALDMQI